eukprot:m.288508 g.288508  ORF g.288508 m.288508 type:complete len:293 (-) comp11974_c0_seq1:203-1081(-)
MQLLETITVSSPAPERCVGAQPQQQEPSQLSLATRERTSALLHPFLFVRPELTMARLQSRHYFPEAGLLGMSAPNAFGRSLFESSTDTVSRGQTQKVQHRAECKDHPSGPLRKWGSLASLTSNASRPLQSVSRILRRTKSSLAGAWARVGHGLTIARRRPSEVAERIGRAERDFLDMIHGTHAEQEGWSDASSEDVDMPTDSSEPSRRTSLKELLKNFNKKFGEEDADSVNDNTIFQSDAIHYGQVVNNPLFEEAGSETDSLVLPCISMHGFDKISKCAESEFEFLPGAISG